MAAFIAHLEPEIGDVFFADLEIVGDFLALGLFAPAAFVESKFGIDKTTVIFEKPSDPIKWSSPSSSAVRAR